MLGLELKTKDKSTFRTNNNEINVVRMLKFWVDLMDKESGILWVLWGDHNGSNSIRQVYN